MNAIPKVADLERAHGVTWGQLAGLEPQLAELLWQARAAGAGCQDREDLQREFAPIRDAVAELVGLRGRHRNCPLLGSVGAYEVAYWRLREAVASLLPRPATDPVVASERGMSSVHHQASESESPRHGASLEQEAWPARKSERRPSARKIVEGVRG